MGDPMGRPLGGSRRPFPGHSFFLFAPSGLCRPSLGCILLPLCPFGPLPSRPSAFYPSRGVVITVALRLTAHKNTHHGMRIPGRRNPRTKTCRRGTPLGSMFKKKKRPSQTEPAPDVLQIQPPAPGHSLFAPPDEDASEAVAGLATQWISVIWPS